MGSRDGRQREGRFPLLQSIFGRAEESWPGSHHQRGIGGGEVGYADLAHYCASKFAVVGFTNALAKEVAQDNITVNAICPGIVRTPMWEQLLDARRDGNEARDATWKRVALSQIPSGRAQTPQDMGDMAVYLASAPNLTGQAINLDGGMSLS
jgi:meso-butanediol dehydrogenase/(S,S)-butanediol dehydrogenase/diacetyl reductase